MGLESLSEQQHNQFASNFLVSEFRKIGINAKLDASKTQELKDGSEDNTEVRKLSLDLNFPLANLDNVLHGLESITTNREIVNTVIDRVNLLRALEEALQYINIDDVIVNKGILGEVVDSASLFKMISKANVQVAKRLFDLGFFDNESEFNTIEKLKEISLGDKLITIPLEIVYKRIPNAQSQINREIMFYTEFDTAGINTFCAFKFAPVDQAGGAYDYTKFEPALKTLAVSDDLFKVARNGKTLFRSILEELLKAHTNRLLHGDLHFKNIGYIEDTERGRYIVLFDLVKSSKLNQEASNFEKSIKFRAELTGFANNLMVKAMDLLRGADAKAMAEQDLDFYFQTLESTYGFDKKEMEDIKDTMSKVYGLLNS